MDIILLQDIEKVGDKHTLVTVKDGFARNYLIPQKLAIIANETNRRRLDDLRRRESRMLDKMRGVASELAEKITGTVIKIGAKAGASGKIFGSVTNIQLAAALKEQLNIDIDRKKIEIAEEVKDLGSYVAAVQLHPDVTTNINFEVVGE